MKKQVWIWIALAAVCSVTAHASVVELSGGETAEKIIEVPQDRGFVFNAKATEDHPIDIRWVDESGKLKKIFDCGLGYRDTVEELRYYPDRHLVMVWTGDLYAVDLKRGSCTPVTQRESIQWFELVPGSNAVVALGRPESYSEYGYYRIFQVGIDGNRKSDFYRFQPGRWIEDMKADASLRYIAFWDENKERTEKNLVLIDRQGGRKVLLNAPYTTGSLRGFGYKFCSAKNEVLVSYPTSDRSMQIDGFNAATAGRRPVTTLGMEDSVQWSEDCSTAWVGTSLQSVVVNLADGKSTPVFGDGQWGDLMPMASDFSQFIHHEYHYNDPHTDHLLLRTLSSNGTFKAREVWQGQMSEPGFIGGWITAEVPAKGEFWFVEREASVWNIWRLTTAGTEKLEKFARIDPKGGKYESLIPRAGGKGVLLWIDGRVISMTDLD